MPDIHDAITAAFGSDFGQFKLRYVEEAQASSASTDAGRERAGAESWNGIGKVYLNAKIPAAAEEMYRWALEHAQQVETSTGVRLHKGIEYCNLAIALLAQGRLDGAIVLLECAEAEDHRYGPTSHAGINVLDRFILRQAFQLLLTRIAAFVAGTPVTEADLQARAIQLWSKMDRRSKARLAGTLQDVADVAGDTKTARVARLDALQHVTHLIEGLLRESYPAAGSLPELLSKGLGVIRQADLDSYSNAVGGFSPCNISGEVSGRLSEIAAAASEGEVLLAAAEATLGLRHYTHHQFNVDGALFNDAGFGPAFDALLLVLTHLHLTTPVLITPSLLSFARPFPVQITPVTPHPDDVTAYVIGAAADIISDAPLQGCQAHWDNDGSADVLTVTLQVHDPSLETWQAFASALQVELSLDGTVPISVKLEQG